MDGDLLGVDTVGSIFTYLFLLSYKTVSLWEDALLKGISFLISGESRVKVTTY